MTDALSKLMESEAIYAYQFEGQRYDVGDKLGFIKTTIELALKREDLKDDLWQYLQLLVENEKVREVKR